MLFAVRHGRTALNEDGSEHIRSWLNVPLTLEGMQQSMVTAQHLSTLEPPYKLYTSDLVRAVQSATEVAMALKTEIYPSEALRDWNLGQLAGQEVKKILPTILQYIDQPTNVVPGGESYQNFLDRCIPFVKSLVENEDVNIAITHNRVISLLVALAKNGGSNPDISLLKEKSHIEPSEVLIIDPDWKLHKLAFDNPKAKRV